MTDLSRPPADPGSDPGGPDLSGVAGQVFHALADQAWDRATDLVEANWGHLITHQLHVVRAVADALPEEFLANSPRWSSVRQFVDHLLLSRRLRGMPYTWHPRRSPNQTPIDTLAQLTEAAIEARTIGEYATALSLVADGLGMLSRAPGLSGEPGGQLLPALLYQLGLAAEFAAGEDLALDAFHKAYGLAIADGDMRTAANSSGELAWIHALAGRGRAADDWIDRHLGITSVSPRARMLRTTIHIVLAVRAHDALRLDEAAAELAKADDGAFAEHRAIAVAHEALFDAFAERADTWELLGRIDMEAAELGSLAEGAGLNRFVMDYARAVVLDFGGQAEGALAILDAGIAAGGTRFLLARRAATHYALSDVEAAEKDAELVLGSKRTSPRALTEGLVVKAATAWRKSDRLGAIESFQQAVRIAIENGLLIALAVVPLDDLVALVDLAYPEGAPAELAAVIARPELFGPPVVAIARLTRQEQRVLIELATGRTLAAVAVRLHVTENTVKAHTRAIYRKLGVGNRADMVSEATRRGLI